MVVGIQPKPKTAAFRGFGMLGLLVGYVFTRCREAPASEGKEIFGQAW